MTASSRSKPSQQPYNWRTSIELVLAALVLYIIIGAPGLGATALSRYVADKPSTKTTGHVSNSTLVTPSPDLQCVEHKYQAHVYSTRPLIIYIDGFLNKSEARHLVDASTSRWQTSTVYNNGVETTDSTVRKSERALLTRDHIVQCLEARALAIQGWPADTYIEQLWTQRYNASGHYAMHYDWASDSKVARRASTFNVYVQAPQRGGGTHFPRLPHPGRGSKWCKFIDCDVETDANDAGLGGVVFKPRAGAAVFWQNFDEEGRGFKETVHAGLPVLEGIKIGLNIWSWYQKT
nr:hypothetical protein B0A51_13337 [Rachicladosporium sp. CCFEE 5018]